MHPEDMKYLILRDVSKTFLTSFFSFRSYNREITCLAKIIKLNKVCAN